MMETKIDLFERKSVFETMKMRHLKFPSANDVRKRSSILKMSQRMHLPIQRMKFLLARKLKTQHRETRKLPLVLQHTVDPNDLVRRMRILIMPVLLERSVYPLFRTMKRMRM